MAYIKSQEYQEKLNNIAIKTCKELIDWVNAHNGKMPRGVIYKNGKTLTIEEMTEEEKAEVRLCKRWKKTRAMQEYLKMPIEEIPEEYRDIILTIKNIIVNKRIWKEVEEWLELHNGKMPSAAICKNKKVVKTAEMTEEERRGVNLRQRWDKSRERKIFERYSECPEEQIPTEYREIIKKLKSLGLSKTAYDELIEWLEAHNGRMVRKNISKDGRKLTRAEMTEEERAEVKLYQKWKRSLEAYIFSKYNNQPIENVPEEYREKIAKLRELMQDSQNKNKKIKNRMRQAVGKQIGNNMTTREQLSAEDMLLEDNNQEENNR